MLNSKLSEFLAAVRTEERSGKTNGKRAKRFKSSELQRKLVAEARKSR